MRIAFITRSTFYTVPGGDTVQVLQTAACLREQGIEVDILLTTDTIDYGRYDLFHYINITRPADILYHSGRTEKPFVVSPILVDYSEYDKHHRKGISGFILSNLPANSIEYAKTIGRWVSGNDNIRSKAYLWKGQRNSIREVLQKAAMVLPNSEAEYKALELEYGIKKNYRVVPNGIDTRIFAPDESIIKDQTLVLCAARIEGIKNQLNLIKALNNSRYTLMLVGSPAPNQRAYYGECRKLAWSNIEFRERVSQQELAGYYKKAKVHALPSWFETCGLSSLEAAAMGCNIMITEKGYTREYFGNDAYYCDPGEPASIFEGIERAAKNPCKRDLQEKILHQYTWQRAACITREAYQKIIQA